MKGTAGSYNRYTLFYQLLSITRQKMTIFYTVTTSFHKEDTNKLPHDKYTLFWAYSQSFIKTYKYRVSTY